jgi:hypothetical protein
MNSVSVSPGVKTITNEEEKMFIINADTRLPMWIVSLF